MSERGEALDSGNDAASYLEMRKARIRQANALAKSGQELDLNEKRLLLLAMSRIKSNDKELLTHKIGMSELTTYLGANPYARAERAARGLLRRLVYVPTENGGFKEFQWTTVAEYVPHESSELGESYVKIRLNEELAPLLLELRERYNTIPLLDLLPMESFNGQRLYEILWHDSHGGEKRVLTYSIADLKFSLGMRVLEQKGAKKVWTEKYKAWRDFRKMLERAREEFLTHGRLGFTFDALRQGRAIQSIRFNLTFTPNTLRKVASDEQPAAEPLSPEIARLASELRELGYVQDPVTFIQSHGLEIVMQALKLGRAAEARALNTARPIGNLPGFVQHLVTSGAAARSLVSGGQEEDQDLSFDERGLTRELRASFEAFQNQVAESVFASLTEDTLKALPETLRVELEVQRRFYLIDVLDKVGWEGPQYLLARNAYLFELYQDELPDTARDVQRFVREHELVTGLPPETVEHICAVLQAEFTS